MPPLSRATEQAKMKACDHCSEQQQRSTNGQKGNEELINKLKSLNISVIPCIWNKCFHSLSNIQVINMCVKFKAKPPWSGPFDKDRQWTTEETWKIIVCRCSRHKLHDITHFLFRQCWLHTFLVSAMFQPTFSKPFNYFSLIRCSFCKLVLSLLCFWLVTHSNCILVLLLADWIKRGRIQATQQEGLCVGMSVCLVSCLRLSVSL